jgi:hypothetical protein
MVNNSLYVSHKVIYADLSRKFKDKLFEEDDIIEWVGICESRYTHDIDMMFKFTEVPLTVQTIGNRPMAKLPCNIFRLLDVYTSSDWKSTQEHYNNGEYLILPDGYTLQYVFINYIGTPISDDGEPLIVKGHENAVETFIKLQAFEEDWINQSISPTVYGTWQQMFSGQIQNSKYTFRHFDRSYFEKLMIIHGNSVPKIGTLPLYNNQFNEFPKQ